MRGKHIVFQNLNNGFWGNKFEDGKILRKLSSGNLLVATKDGIKELEPKQVILTDKPADWFNSEVENWWNDGGSFGIDMIPDEDLEIYHTLDPEYGAFGYYG